MHWFFFFMFAFYILRCGIIQSKLYLIVSDNIHYRFTSRLDIIAWASVQKFARFHVLDHGKKVCNNGIKINTKCYFRIAISKSPDIYTFFRSLLQRNRSMWYKKGWFAKSALKSYAYRLLTFEILISDLVLMTFRIFYCFDLYDKNYFWIIDNVFIHVVNAYIFFYLLEKYEKMCDLVLLTKAYFPKSWASAQEIHLRHKFHHVFINRFFVSFVYVWQ